MKTLESVSAIDAAKAVNINLLEFSGDDQQALLEVMIDYLLHLKEVETPKVTRMMLPIKDKPNDTLCLQLQVCADPELACIKIPVQCNFTGFRRPSRKKHYSLVRLHVTKEEPVHIMQTVEPCVP